MSEANLLARLIEGLIDLDRIHMADENDCVRYEDAMRMITNVFLEKGDE